MSLLLFICFVAVVGVIASRMAKLKGRDPVMWFWLGVLFGLIALIVLYFLKDLKSSKESPEVHVVEEKKLDSAGVWYFLDQKQSPAGPFSFDDIRAMFKEGSLSTSSYLWYEEWTDWKLASDVPGLEKS